MVAVVVLAHGGHRLLGERVEGTFELLHVDLEDGVGHVAYEEVLLHVGVGQGRIIRGFRNPFCLLPGGWDRLLASKWVIFGQSKRPAGGVRSHPSGIRNRPTTTRARFASDLLNLTLAAPGLNRHEKGGKDAAAWLPARNRCWFAATVVAVRRAYGLTIDRDEAAALEGVLTQCDSTEMEPVVCVPDADAGQVGTAGTDGDDVLARCDDNGNGRITCREARRHGIAPVRRGHPVYRYMRDGDGDGVVCE